MGSPPGRPFVLLCWGFVGLEGCRCWSFTIFFSVGGCLGAPKVVHEPHRGEFSVPNSRPCSVPCIHGGGGGGGFRGGGWKLVGACRGNPGGPACPRALFSSQWCLLSSSLLSPQPPSAAPGAPLSPPAEMLPHLSPVSAFPPTPPCLQHPGAPFPTSQGPPRPSRPFSPAPPTSFPALKGKTIRVSLTSSGLPEGQTSLCICLPWSWLRPLAPGDPPPGNLLA